MKDYFTELDHAKILIGQKDRYLSARQLEDIPFFFVVGRPRSGTTLLSTLFDAHPNVKFPPECQFIINLYPKYGKIRNWSVEKLEAFYHELLTQWYFDFWTLDRLRLHENLMKCTGEFSYGTICKVVYNEYRSIFKHGMLLAIGDKNPGYTIYTTKLLKIFPEARFIHIVRDYRDNFVSIRNVDFELPFISVTVNKWRYFVRKFRKAAEKHPGTHIEVKYEDLVSKPEEQFKALCEFIGIPFSSIPFDFYKKSSEVLKIYPSDLILKYHSSLLKKINTSRVGLWKKELTKSEIRKADACAGKYAELTGYQKVYPRAKLMTYIQSSPGWAFAKLLSVSTSIIDTFPYKLRMAILVKAPWFMGRLYLRIFNKNKLVELNKKMKQKPDLSAHREKLSGLKLLSDKLKVLFL